MLIRAFATSTLRTVLLHFLVLLVCGGLLWQQLPRLLPSVANWLLEDTGVTLVTLALQPQTYPPYFINEIKLKTASHSLQARNIYLHQLSPWQFQWRIDVGHVQVTALEPISPAEGLSAPTADQVWQSLSAALAPLSQHGNLDHIEYCADGCLVGAISWQRNTDQLVLNATESGYGAQLAIRAVENRVTVSMVIDTTVDTAVDTASASHARLGQTLAQHLPTQLSVEAQMQPFANGDLDIQGNVVLGAKRQRFSLTEAPEKLLRVDLATTPSRFSFAATVPKNSPITLVALQQAADYHLNAEVHASWLIERAETAVSSNSSLAFTLTSKKGDLDLELKKPVSAQVIYPDLSNVEINIAPDLRCHMPGDDNALVDRALTDSAFADSAFADSAFACQIPRIGLKGGYDDIWRVDTVFTDSHVERAAGSWSATGNARVLVNDKQQRLLTMDSQLQASNTHVQVRSDNARAYQLPLKSVTLDHDLIRDTGELQVTLDTHLSEALKLPPLNSLPRLQAVRGKLKGTTRVFWPPQRKSLAQLRIESHYELHDIDFGYDDYQFSGLNLQLVLDGWPHMVSPRDALLQISQINVGLPLTNINARFAIDMDWDSGSTMLTGQALSFDVLGGTASSNQWHLDPLAESGFIPLTLQDLALQQILALGQNDLDSSGSITGSVPVDIQNGTIDIQQGRLDAIPPGGYIRYRPDDATREMLLQSGQTKIVLETLSDFQYDSLAVLLSYSPAGNLVANTALRGRNPGFEAGREIRFNLSIEQNIDTLLRSLRLSENVEKKIQNRSQKRQNPMPAIEVKP